MLFVPSAVPAASSIFVPAVAPLLLPPPASHLEDFTQLRAPTMGCGSGVEIATERGTIEIGIAIEIGIVIETGREIQGTRTGQTITTKTERRTVWTESAI
jgi:hypothetical protein